MAAPETGTESKAYAEEAPLMALFGTPARTKLISVFVAERGRDLSKSELARQAGISRSTVYDHLDALDELGVIEHVRDTQDGHSARYALDESTDVGELLYKLEGVTLRRLLELDGSLNSGDPVESELSSLKIGDEVVVDVTDIHDSGAGVGHTQSGSLVLVNGILPDARARVKITEIKSSYARAEELERLPMPDREGE